MVSAITDSTDVWEGLILCLLINEVKVLSRDTSSNIFTILKDASIFIILKHLNGSKDCLCNRGERE